MGREFAEEEEGAASGLDAAGVETVGTEAEMRILVG